MSSTIDMNLFIQALIVNGIIAVLAYFAKAVSKSGILGGLIVGIPIYTFMGWQGFVILFSMFAIGTLATKWGYQKKKELGLAEKNEGQRGISNVLGKCLAGVIFAIALHFQNPLMNSYTFFNLAFLASFASGTFDTVSSEMGQLYGKKFFTLVPLSKAQRGDEGAISFEGTLAGIIGAFIIVLIYNLILFTLQITHLPNEITIGDEIISFFIILIPFSVMILMAAFISNLLESLLGSILESKRKINKFLSNFLNTFSGGLIAGGLYFMFSRIIAFIFWPLAPH